MLLPRATARSEARTLPDRSRWCKSARDAKDLQQLGLGLLLHDVGKMRIPTEILNKPGKLTTEEMDLMKLHPVYGHEMVKGRVPANVASVVLNHHHPLLRRRLSVAYRQPNR